MPNARAYGSKGSSSDDEAEPVMKHLTAEQEEAFITKAEEEHARQVQVGHNMYLVDARWWKKWQDYSGFGQDCSRDMGKDRDQCERPGPIDNKGLLTRTSIASLSDEVRQLKQSLTEETDYVLVSEGSWKKLLAWYGGGPEIARPVVLTGEAKKPLVLLYNMTLQVYHSAALTKPKSINIDTMATVRELKRRACGAFSIPESDVIMYDYFNRVKQTNMDQELDKQLTEQGILPDQDILLHDKAKDNSYDDSEVVEMPSLFDDTAKPAVAQPVIALGYETRSSRAFPTYEPEDATTSKSSVRPGLAGLSNLGNTCFMNSSLQCLAHTVPLMQCFLSGQFEKDLNRVNPLGTGGELATAFGSLMHKLWRGEVSYVAPRSFKAKVGKHAPQFSGYLQHDSQEFLEFVLDKMHEDIDRHKSKPYIEEKDAGDRTDNDIADEAWNIYKARNDSFIVDHFQGLYKSTLDCPKCGARGRKFDPIMYLSLPLPDSRFKAITYTAIMMDGSAPPLELTIEVPMAATVSEVLEAMRRQLVEAGLMQEPSSGGMEEGTTAGPAPPSVRASDLMQAATIRQFSPTLRLLSPKDRVAEFRLDGGDRLWVYIYPSPEEGPASGRKLVTLNQKRPSTFNTYSTHHVMKSFGAPLLLFLPAEALAQSIDYLRAMPKDHSASEYHVIQESLLYRELRRVLRPFRTARAVAAEEQEEAGAAAAAAAPMEASPAAEPAAGIDVPEAPGTPPRDDAEPISALPPTVIGQAVGGDGDGSMEVELQERPAGSGVADAGSETVAGSSGSPTVPTREPFNMWAGQEAATTDGRVHGGAGASTATPAAVPVRPAKPPFTVKLQSGQGVTTFWSHGKGPTPPETALDRQEYVVEWSEAADDVYDPRPMESPARHESAMRFLRNLNSPRKVTLEACMEAFLQPEQLSEADTWRCTSCKDFVQAFKKLDLWTLPEVLVIVLKRFSYTRYHRDKLDTHVSYPTHDLNLAPYVLKPQDVPPMYDLFAVINHYGGLGGGHYTAYAQMPGEQQWYSFDDSSVSVMKEESVVTSAGYVLFYRRQHEAAQDPPTLVQDLVQGVRDAAEAAETLTAKPPPAAAPPPPPLPPPPVTSTATTSLPAPMEEEPSSSTYPPGGLPVDSGYEAGPSDEPTLAEMWSDQPGKGSSSAVGDRDDDPVLWEDASGNANWQSDAEEDGTSPRPRMPAIAVGTWGPEYGDSWNQSPERQAPDPFVLEVDDSPTPNSPAAEGEGLELMSTSV